ncbi:MAG: ComEC/Rec2 family competence protein [Clostridia bacterium]|nr:ComEC/Rec2 family competence protein [Clostridia bacterium]
MIRQTRRPLALFAVGFLSALLLLLSRSLAAAFLVFAAGAGAFALLFLLARRRPRLFTAAVLLLGFALGALWQGVYELAFIRPVQKLAGRESAVEVLITEKRSYGFSGFASVEGKKTKVFLRLYDDGTYAPGDRLSFTGKLALPSGSRGFDGERYFLSAGIPLTVTPVGEIEAEKEAFAPLSFVHRLRSALLVRVTRLFGGFAGEMSALLWGDRASLPEETRLELTRTGLSHAFVVSGMHLSFVISLFALLRTRRSYLFFAIPAALLFAFLTGFGISVLRAFLMLCYAALGSALRRPRDPITSLLSTLLLILLFNPFALYDAGLVYSYLAVAGIFFLSPRLSEFLSLPAAFLPGRVPAGIFRALAGAAAVATAAGVATLPASLLYTGRISLVFLPANLLLLWMVPVLFLGGMAAVLVSYLFYPLGALLGAGLRMLLSLFLSVDRLLGSLPGAVLGAEHILFPVLAFAALGFLFLTALRGRRFFRPLSLSVLVLPFLVLILALRLTPQPLLSLTALPSRNDCVLLTAGGKTFLLGYDEEIGDLLERRNLASPDYLIPGPEGADAPLRFPDAVNLEGENLLLLSDGISAEVSPNGNLLVRAEGKVLRILLSPAPREDADFAVLGKAVVRDGYSVFLPDAPSILLGKPPASLPASLSVEASPYLEGEVTLTLTNGVFSIP